MKNVVLENFSYQPSLMLLGVEIKCVDISISNINYVTIVMILIFIFGVIH